MDYISMFPCEVFQFIIAETCNIQNKVSICHNMITVFAYVNIEISSSRAIAIILFETAYM